MKSRSHRRTETTIEAHEVWVIRGRGKQQPPSWCPECAGQARMFAPEEAAKLREVSTRTIYRWVEAGRIHFRETPDRGVIVCLASLPAKDTAPALPAAEMPAPS